MQEKDNGVQKKSYKVVAYLCESRPEFVKANLQVQCLECCFRVLTFFLSLFKIVMLEFLCTVGQCMGVGLAPPVPLSLDPRRVMFYWIPLREPRL